VVELGEEVARILSELRTLSTELARAQGDQCDDGEGPSNAIVHLRLVLSGSELSLIPFELAVAPQAYPGEGLEFCLQASLPIVVTRELRRSRPLPVSWNGRTPKILFVSAAPEGMKVPARAHVHALRAALEPWTRKLSRPSEDEEQNHRDRLELVKENLRLLPNASVEQIHDACAKERFTHVHVLAHGDVYEHAGQERFGVALHREGDDSAKEVVSGKRLAKALQAEDANGNGRSDPLVVTLATCDAGNQSTVLVPGGSIAHDLHSEGIPWVFASQFPLTVPGSVRMTRVMYPRLLRGDDPRQMLFELRRRLYESQRNDHDWASLVAYASLPEQFEDQVDDFCARQMKGAINVKLAHTDDLLRNEPPTGKAEDRSFEQEAARVAEEVEGLLKAWFARMPKGSTARDLMQRSEITGMHGATFKRLALQLEAAGLDDQAEHYYSRSRESYKKAMAEAGAWSEKYCWTATQFLSLQAVRHGERDATLHTTASRLARRDLTAENATTQAWAHATCAELEMLACYHGTDPEAPPPDGVVERVVDHCREIVRLTDASSFQVASTRRQFQRYVNHWPNALWDAVARAAVNALSPEGDIGEFPRA